MKRRSALHLSCVFRLSDAAPIASPATYFCSTLQRLVSAQVVGTHNSYHLAPPQAIQDLAWNPLVDAVAASYAQSAVNTTQYNHLSLYDQLDIGQQRQCMRCRLQSCALHALLTADLQELCCKSCACQHPCTCLKACMSLRTNAKQLTTPTSNVSNHASSIASSIVQ